MTNQGLLLAGGLVFALAIVFGMANPDSEPIEGPFASAELVTTEYVVSGGSLDAVKRQIARKRPQEGWGRAWPEWSWDAECNVDLRVRVTMPKLQGRWRLSADELAIWDAMIDALWQHEMTHVEISIDAARQIKEAGCDRAAVNEITARHNSDQTAFDRRTQSGFLEGVTLDP